MQFCCIEQPYDLCLDGGSSRDYEHFVASQVFAPLAVHEAVVQIAFCSVNKRLIVVIVGVCIFPGAFVYHPFYSLQMFAGSFQLGVHHLEDPRHGAEPVGMTVCEISGKCAQTFGIVDAYADILVLVVHAPFIDMAQRQETQHFLVGAYCLFYGMAVGIEHQVVMGQHHSLRGACRA